MENNQWLKIYPYRMRIAQERLDNHQNRRNDFLNTITSLYSKPGKGIQNPMLQEP